MSGYLLPGNEMQLRVLTLNCWGLYLVSKHREARIRQVIINCISCGSINKTLMHRGLVALQVDWRGAAEIIIGVLLRKLVPLIVLHA